MELVDEYEAHGHHQPYWVDRCPVSTPDFKRILREMVSVGSPVGIAIEVLLAQGASQKECEDAIASLAKENDS